MVRYLRVINMKYALAIDIGASSGRHIVGWLEDGAINTKEVYRFPNGVRENSASGYCPISLSRVPISVGLPLGHSQFHQVLYAEAWHNYWSDIESGLNC